MAFAKKLTGPSFDGRRTCDATDALSVPNAFPSQKSRPESGHSSPEHPGATRRTARRRANFQSARRGSEEASSAGEAEGVPVLSHVESGGSGRRTPIGARGALPSLRRPATSSLRGIRSLPFATTTHSKRGGARARRKRGGCRGGRQQLRTPRGWRGALALSATAWRR